MLDGELVESVEVHAGDDFAEIAMKFHLSPSRLQMLNNLYPPVIDHDMVLKLESPYAMAEVEHSVFVVLASNNVEIPGTITIKPDSFTFVQRNLRSSGKRIEITVNIVSVISTEVIPHPNTESDESASAPSVLIICYQHDPLRVRTMDAIAFVASRAELHALELHIRKISRRRQNEIRFVKTIEAAHLCDVKTQKLLEELNVSSRYRRPYCDVSSGFHIEGTSKVIDRVELIEVRKVLPFRFKSYSWRLIFSVSVDGTSYHSLYAATEAALHCFILVRTQAGDKIGAFLTAGLKKSSRFYGSGEMFVFNFKPTVNIYKATLKNSEFISSTMSEIIIGGNNAAIWIDERLLNGISEPSETFGSPSLTTDSQFTVMECEVWELVRA